ncbi:MAG TPA: PP2C family protein-serine/threonine phosphatase [Candidatus Acidoferrales bacterium]|nr:PP2C family protein-serine/threonine phosphatase [Candidatus Acidoferrales bacterium]
MPDTPRTRRGRVGLFWARITEGLALEQLWGQFLSEAKASYGLYSREVDWNQVHRQARGPGRIWLSVWALFQAMLMKLTPARRVLLLIAIAFLIVEPDVRWGKHEVSIQLAGFGSLILFLLLALELADRVAMKRDLEIAREIQQRLVPEVPPAVSGLDIAFATRPQNTVAGDYYDAFLRPLPDLKPLLLIVADVAGKSVPAALLMATFQASLRALSATPANLEGIVTGLDRYTRAHNMDGRRFTTAFLAEVNPQTHEMRYTNAGQNDPVLRHNSGEIERLSRGGPPFGLPLFTDGELKYESQTLVLRPADLLVIFTDGLVEAVDERGEEFGESRLLASIRSVPQERAAATLERVMNQVNAFVGLARQHDDITCMVVRVDG